MKWQSCVKYEWKRKQVLAVMRNYAKSGAILFRRVIMTPKESRVVSEWQPAGNWACQSNNSQGTNSAKNHWTSMRAASNPVGPQLLPHERHWSRSFS